MTLEEVRIKFEGMKLIYDIGEYDILELKNRIKKMLIYIKRKEPFLYDRSLKIANEILLRCV